MKHETANTFIALAALVLAVFSTVKQLIPAGDSITLTTEAKVNLSKPISIISERIQLSADGYSNALIGPIFWKIRVYNNTDRSVSIVDSEVFLIAGGGGKMFYSEIDGELIPADLKIPLILFPDNIAPHEGRAYIIKLNIPIRPDSDNETSCLKNVYSLKALEHCFMRKGRDLFGNEVEAVFDPVDDSLFYAEWPSIMKEPVFSLMLKTADGSEFFTEISYFPSFSKQK